MKLSWAKFDEVALTQHELSSISGWAKLSEIELSSCELSEVVYRVGFS